MRTVLVALILLSATAFAEDVPIAGDSINVTSKNLSSLGICLRYAPLEDGYQLIVEAPHRISSATFQDVFISRFDGPSVQVSPAQVRAAHMVTIKISGGDANSMTIHLNYLTPSRKRIFYFLDLPELQKANLVDRPSSTCTAA